MGLMFAVLVIGLSAGITAFRMAWTEQHRKLASVGILMCGFGLLQMGLPVLFRGIVPGLS